MHDFKEGNENWWKGSDEELPIFNRVLKILWPLNRKNNLFKSQQDIQRFHMETTENIETTIDLIASNQTPYAQVLRQFRNTLRNALMRAGVDLSSNFQDIFYQQLVEEFKTELVDIDTESLRV